MINIKDILQSFTNEKQEELILYLEKKNKRADTKNIQLVKLLIAENLSSKEICLKLYQKDNKPALHALRKRLFQSIIDFTANSNLKEENSIDMQLIKFIISARVFLKKGQFTIGYKILEKAEITAKEHQLFTILNEIYHSKIQYSYAIPSLNIDEIIINFKENQQQLLLEEKMNIAYAKIRKALQDVQHQHKIIDIKAMIENVLEDHQINISSSFSFKPLYQILQITNISSAQNFDYWNIESFLLETYELMKNHKSKEKQLFYHIEIIYLIANTLFRNKKFTQSLKYLDLMHDHMQQQKSKYFKEYNPKYKLLLALNHNYSGNQEKAIDLLIPFTNQKNIDIIAQLDIYLSLIVFYSQRKELKKAQNLFSEFYHTDKYYIEKAGIEWTIKKNIIEILLQIDLGNIDIVESRILSFKRAYFKHLKSINQKKVITFIKLVEIYYKNPEIITSNDFEDKVETSFNWIGKEKEDIFMMSFFAWLKAKMTKQDMYLVTIDFMKT
ncbi:hypothetical protein H9W90_04270 [Polaribacter pectinis]|uniref:Uncharacterized protein n=1 Tax=Polaribacter pectinis TaxID=2738844 RepID=A0A7G9LCJ8_9FLAO|nr:hypothetical protein [Polaribacter pectinis]QNM86347.1 hypothetical protein H9W90_04270 [Polaribacter pectinis]